MQRRRLLLAFGEVASTSGLEAATVGRVCEQAAVSRRTFYELFSDREDCLLAAFDQAVERFARQVLPVFRANGSWRERIRAALSLLLEELDAEPDLARLCIVEAPRAGHQLLERRRDVLEVLAIAVDEGRAQTRSGAEPPPLTAQGVVGGVLSVIHARLIESSPSSTAGSLSNGRGQAGRDSAALVDLTNPLMAMIVHPYLGPTAAQKELERPAPSGSTQLAPRWSRPLQGPADPLHLPNGTCAGHDRLRDGRFQPPHCRRLRHRRRGPDVTPPASPGGLRADREPGRRTHQGRAQRLGAHRARTRRSRQRSQSKNQQPEGLGWIGDVLGAESPSTCALWVDNNHRVVYK